MVRVGRFRRDFVDLLPLDLGSAEEESQPLGADVGVDGEVDDERKQEHRLGEGVEQGERGEGDVGSEDLTESTLSKSRTTVRALQIRSLINRLELLHLHVLRKRKIECGHKLNLS